MLLQQENYRYCLYYTTPKIMSLVKIFKYFKGGNALATFLKSFSN